MGLGIAKHRFIEELGMRVAFLACLTAAACAGSSAAGGGAPAPDQTVRVVGATSSSSITMAGNDASSSRTVTSSLDQVWRVLPLVFDSLGISVQTLDPVRHAIGNPAFAA